MNEFQTYEYTVCPKAEGKLLVKKILMLSLYVAFVLGAFILVLSLRILAPLFAVAPLLTYALVSRTWKYVNVSYEISVTSGIFTFSKIYGNKKRKTVFEIPISKMLAIAPYNSKHLDKLERLSPETSYEALPCENCQNKYFAVFDTDGDKRACFVFEYNEKLLTVCKFYNAISTVIERPEGSENRNVKL